jgi:hypothetical protein
LCIKNLEYNKTFNALSLMNCYEQPKPTVMV